MICFQDLCPDANSKKDSKRDSEVQNDNSLLKSIDSHLADKFSINILQLVTLQAVTSHGQIYTKERCNEFHKLLCALLKGFATSLEALPDRGDSTSSSSQSRVNGLFKGRLGDVLYYGCCLKYIVDGSALDHYLYNLEIEQLLADHRRDTMLHADSSRNYDLNLDLNLYRPTASKLNGRLVPCWKSYKQWLKLMLIYFTAAETIIVYVMGKLAF